MRHDYLRDIRFKLQKRYRRLNSMSHQMFHSGLKQFWGFLSESVMIQGVIAQLESQSSLVSKEVDEIFNENVGLVFDTERESVIAAYLIVKKCVESNDEHIEIQLAHKFCHESKHQDNIDFFRENFVELLYEYIDENLDDQRLVLSLLLHYKQKCEWFQREKLFGVALSDTSRGEKSLAIQLYEYLHDQGIEFYIEPESISGEVDVISSQSGEDRLLADVKIFCPEKSKGKTYLVNGFRQLHDYCVDFNENVGYLIIFKTCEESLRITANSTSNGVAFSQRDGKTIYFVVIDLFPYEKSASKRGQLKCVEIADSDWTKKVEGESAGTVDAVFKALGVE